MTVLCPHPAALVDQVGDALLAAVRSSFRAPFTLALSGGSTPRRLYETLAARADIPWLKLELFFGDERAVPPSSPDSNFRVVQHALLDRVSAIAHPMLAEQGDVEGYERLLRTRVPELRAGVPVLDLVLLGIGVDGHVASLFPGSPALDSDRLVTMTEAPGGMRRMTITPKLINAARRVWILATGADKAPIIARALGPEADLPVHRVKPSSGELVWWLDEAAYSKA